MPLVVKEWSHCLRALLRRHAGAAHGSWHALHIVQDPTRGGKDPGPPGGGGDRKAEDQVQERAARVRVQRRRPRRQGRYSIETFLK